MKTINIKGKEYVPVVERVKEFLKNSKAVSIETEVIQTIDASRAIVSAKITFSDGRVFTGHSQAVYGEGRMGDVALEVAETSAVGRALGFAGIGLLDDGGIASADEMRKVKKVEGEDDELGF